MNSVDRRSMNGLGATTWLSQQPTMPVDGRADREVYYDAWKGAAIIAVVSIHCVGYLDPTVTRTIRQFINFPVVVFVGLSGHFAPPSMQRAVSPTAWRRKRLLLLVAPYTLFSLVHMLLLRPALLKSPAACFLDGLLLGRGMGGIGYFVIVLMQLTAISRWLAQGRARRAKVVGLFLLNLMLIAASYFGLLRSTPWSGVPLPYPMIFFGTWIIPYLTGMALQQHGPTLRQRNILLVPLVLLGLAASVAEGYIFRHVPLLAHSQIKLSSFATSWLLLVIICRTAQGQSAKWWLRSIARIGEFSFFIYLTHGLLLAFTAKAFFFFERRQLLDTADTWLIVAANVIGVVFLTKAGGLLRRWLPERLRPYVGLPR